VAAPSPPDAPRPALRRLALLGLGFSVVSGVIGNAFLAVLLSRSPALLLAVQSSYAQMGLAAPRLDPTTFVVIAALRRFLGEGIMFGAGRVLGPSVIEWVTRRRGGPPPRLPAILARPRSALRDAAVVALPHPLLAALFGLSQISAARYVVLKLVGSVLTVAAFRALAEAIGGPLERAGELIDANVTVLTVVGVAGVAVWLHRSRAARKGR
jgi:membrane protein DedA with SNARE-associated domain